MAAARATASEASAVHPSDLLEQDLAATAYELASRDPESPQLVVIVGPAGCGKTTVVLTLSRLVGAAFDAGVDYIDMLGYTSSPLTVDDACAKLIRARLPDVSVARSWSQLKTVLNKVVGTNHILVLDDVKDLTVADALVSQLPIGCVVLCTSRTTRGRPAHAIVVDVPSMQRDTSLRISATLAQQACERLNVSEAQAVAVACDNLPLACVIVARTLHAFPNLLVTQLLDTLLDDIEVTDARDTLERCFWNCFYFLSEPVQNYVRMLSVAPCYVDQHCVNVLFDAHGQPVDEVSELLNSGFVCVDAATGHWKLHSALAWYIQEAEADHPVVIAARRRFVSLYLRLLVDIAAWQKTAASAGAASGATAGDVEQQDDRSPVKALNQHMAQIVFAMQWSLRDDTHLDQIDQIVRDVHVLLKTFIAPSTLLQWYQQLTSVYERTDDHYHLALVQMRLSDISSLTSKPYVVLQHLERAVNYASKSGDALVLVRSLFAYGGALAKLTHGAEGRGEIVRGLAASDERALECEGMKLLGDISVLQEKPTDAVQLYEKSLAIAIACGNKVIQLQSLQALASLCVKFNQPGPAADLYAQVAQLAQDVGDMSMVAQASLAGGSAKRTAGDISGAAVMFGNAARVAKATAQVGIQARATHNLGICAGQSNAMELAVKLWSDSLTLCRESGDDELEARNLYHLGYAAAHHGSIDVTAQCWTASLEIARRIGAEQLERAIIADMQKAGIAVPLPSAELVM
eukprot:TRINITY_DN2416_c0_g1_i1.p1 TRINITY_DN2416_c0_g1~~TRINITY_DN2416_c0_g1_i1.p1  ORF type:complete len:746 (+),score=166.17 TRINITY_DN2416_c0_g1_i1:35-2272(+)